jgi:hypothetical protein
VRFVCQDLGSVFERCPTVRRERDLPDANCALDAMHAQSGQDPGPLTGDRGGSTFGQMVDEKVLAPSAQVQDNTLAKRSGNAASSSLPAR